MSYNTLKSKKIDLGEKNSGFAGLCYKDGWKLLRMLSGKSCSYMCKIEFVRRSNKNGSLLSDLLRRKFVFFFFGLGLGF